ncbi:MAG: GGDEF domain-containing protein [Myxococcales bacterium]|nr:GGDEF domain-containing protein [Myxococcales bacterium]
MSPRPPPARRPEHALRVLVELTRALTEAQVGLETALRLVTDAGVALFACDHASVRVLDDRGEHLLSGARSGASAHAIPSSFRRGLGVAGWVIEHGDVARVDDIATDPRFVQVPGQGFDIGSLLCVPLFSSGGVIGCLSLTATVRGYFSADDEILGRLLANCAVPPLERARLQRLAITDALTGALRQNQLRPVLEGAMQAARAHGGTLSIVALDLDHFKRVNDDFGHLVGDEVLRVFARRVREQVRAEDIVVRRGGEEFVVVLPACDLDVAIAAAERIRGHLATVPMEVEGLSILQRVSAGVARWDGKESAASLERRADDALYAAKRAGRDRVVVADAA